MMIINTLADIRDLVAAGRIPADLANFLERKLRRTCEAVDVIPVEKFSLEMHGPFGVLEPGDRDLRELGVFKPLGLLMPEWVGRVELTSGCYNLAYLFQDNDYIPIAVIRQETAAETIRDWLAEQTSEEEEAGAEDEVPGGPL